MSLSWNSEKNRSIIACFFLPAISISLSGIQQTAIKSIRTAHTRQQTSTLNYTQVALTALQLKSEQAAIISNTLPYKIEESVLNRDSYRTTPENNVQ
jgi:hypothetical protein